MAKRSSRRSRSRRGGRVGNSTVIGVGLIALTVLAIVGGLAYDQARITAATSDTMGGYTVPKFNALRVSYLGDSYTDGVGAPEGKGYENRLTDQLCWDETVNAQPGTGYGNPGPAGSGYAPFFDAARIDEITATDPELIIVFGGVNDDFRSDIRQGADSTYAQIAAKAPAAKVVVIGPTLPPTKEPGEIFEVRDELKAAAAAAGLTFIDPLDLGWLTAPGLYGDDQLHPTDAGHKELADDIAQQLSTLGLPRLDTCGAV